MERATNLDRLRRIAAFLRGIPDRDMTPLMEEYARIMVEDNERRLLAGLDVNEQETPDTWRERHVESVWMRNKVSGKPFKAVGSQEGGAGEPLVPRGPASRAIAYFRPIDFGRDSSGWFARCGWRGFDSQDGRSILEMHRKGGPYPVRDLISHVSPTCKQRAIVATRAFAREMMRYRK